MKKMVVLALVVVLAIPVLNLVSKPSTSGIFPAQIDPPVAAVARIVSKNCLHCHATGASLPFYASFPIAKGLIEKDVREGRDAFEASSELFPKDGKPVSEPTLASLEFTTQNNRMPPARYLVMHWDCGLSSADRAVILDWVKKVRRERHKTPGVAAEHQDEPIQPLATPTGLDPAKVELGDLLYHDKRLSKDDSLSCAGCHELGKGGTDQAQFSTGVGKAMGDINAPTSYNSGLIVRQFWDGRAATLEEQAAGPVNNPIEMASNWPQVLEKLRKDAALVEKVKKVYPKGLSPEAITEAIAIFERSLVTVNSKFDQWLAGKGDAIDATEKAGYALFKSQGCITCHVGKPLGGLSFEKMGLKQAYFADQGAKKRDLGRFNATNAEFDRYRFKVPTLRNVAVTFPYFHDGSVKELPEAVAKMGRHQLGIELTSEQTNQLVAFLKTLTGEYKGQRLQ